MAKQERNLNHVYYEQYFGYHGPRTWMERIWRDALGAEYPDELEQYGYVTRHDLAELKARLVLQKGAHLLDVGCGRGGPGLWMAAETGVR